MNYKLTLSFMFLLASFMISVHAQCIPTCTLGTYCFTQNNSAGPDTYYCADCQSNCNNCSAQDTCNTCDVGYSYIVTASDPNTPSGYCAKCISDCISCANNVSSCDNCASGYAFNGTSCNSISNLDVYAVVSSGATQFNMMWIIAIVGGIIGIGLIVTVSYYCMVKRRENKFIIYGKPSVKEEMINGVGQNHFSIYEEPSARHQMIKN